MLGSEYSWLLSSPSPAGPARLAGAAGGAFLTLAVALLCLGTLVASTAAAPPPAPAAVVVRR